MITALSAVAADAPFVAAPHRQPLRGPWRFDPVPLGGRRAQPIAIDPSDPWRLVAPAHRSTPSTAPSPRDPGDEFWWDALAAEGARGDWPYGYQLRAAVEYEGRWIVGGVFVEMGGLVTDNVAAWDGTSWSALGNGLPGGVYALVVHEGQLIAGGALELAGGQYWAAIWDGASWSPLSTGLGESVQAFCIHDGDLYAGCGLSTGGSRVARWSGGSWQTVGWFTSTDPARMPGVLGLVSHGGRLVAGGYFDAVDDILAANVAGWDGESWAPLGAGVSGGDWPYARGFHSGGDLVVGGQFTQAGGVPAENVARWDGAQWHAMGDGLGIPGWPGSASVSTFLLRPEGLWAGGSFFASGSESVNNLALWDGNQWIDPGYWPMGAWCIFGLAECAGQPVALGDFYWIDGRYCHGIARFYEIRWHPLGGYGPAAWPVEMTTYRGELVYGGFDDEVSYFVNSAGAWTGDGWTRLGWDPVPTEFGPFGGIMALEVVEDDLYVGGYFESLFGAGGEEVCHGVARWDGSSWHGMSMDSTSVGIVVDLQWYEGELYAGGNYWVSEDDPGPGLLRWTGTVWETVGGGLDAQSGEVIVGAMAVHDGLLYCGGRFDAAGGSPAANIAAWDGAAWLPLGAGCNGAVRALVVHDGDLVVGGAFDLAGGTVSHSIARWDGATWSTLGSGFTGSEDVAEIWSLTDFGELLVAGGAFVAADDLPANNLAVWNGAAWYALGSGADGTVFALAVHEGELWVGGDFLHVGGNASHRVGRWLGPPVVGIDDSDVATALRLDNATPNPFNPRTTIAFTLDRSERVVLDVLGVDGRRVARLVEETLAAGPHRVTWDGRDGHGRPLPSGVYLMCLQAGSQRRAGKAVLLR
ncbi:MAG: hypothetical protein JW940_36990 [Polyangiaceae bacterium]|nr:hypothetical protein [Polyangiaceae bacterium]